MFSSDKPEKDSNLSIVWGLKERSRPDRKGALWRTHHSKNWVAGRNRRPTYCCRQLVAAGRPEMVVRDHPTELFSAGWCCMHTSPFACYLSFLIKAEVAPMGRGLDGFSHLTGRGRNCEFESRTSQQTLADSSILSARSGLQTALFHARRRRIDRHEISKLQAGLLRTPP